MGPLCGADSHQGRQGAGKGSELLDQGVFQVPPSWVRSKAVRGSWWVSDWVPGISTATPTPGSLQAMVQGSWISGSQS